jgi:hypothetical protein
LEPGKAYVFIANHRDILLDSAILQILLVEYGFETSEITFGSNLMISQFIIDIGKVNRMFTVYREGTRKEKLRNSLILSAYIRDTITRKKLSLWIAQRGGRTKNGSDKTETALLKMLSLSEKEKSFEENIRELNLTPLIISYEYEPCDDLKVQELYDSLEKSYVKKPGEDLNSILTGITQYKGRIHLEVGKPLDEELDGLGPESTGDRFNILRSIIDSQVFRNYRLWPANNIAYDLLHNSFDRSSLYTKPQRDYFIGYLDRKLDSLHGDRPVLKKLFLELYANPVKNQLANS